MRAGKILFIYPSSYDERGRVIKSCRAFVPSRTLPHLAALTPERYRVRIIDELVDELDFDMDCDLVAFTGMLRHMPRAIDLASEFKKRGKATVIGGVGAYALRDKLEASGSFDCTVTGEAENLWEGILDDFEGGRLKRHYSSTAYPTLDGLPLPRFDLLDTKKYMKSFVDRRHPVTLIETGRGCPRNCSFCLVTRYFGKRMRYRTVGDVVDEIRHHGSKFVMFTDDNIAINPARSRELFGAIRPLGIQWLAQFECSVIDNPELLRLAAESGCRTAFVGVESLIPDNLHAVNKAHNAKLEFRRVAEAFRDAGIDLFASIIFGMDHDTPETMAWTIDKMVASGVDAIVPWLITPVPGTPFYDECKRRDRLLHENYSLYDYWHPVVQPEHMTVNELTDMFWKGLRRFYSLPLILRRTVRDRRWHTGGLLYNIYSRCQAYRGLHPYAGNS